MSDAQDRGWGPGWPNCQEEKWVFVTPRGLENVSFGRVHQRIRELVERLIQETHARGYVFKDGQCWGAVCREVRGSNPPVPSNHSWGLALDFNSLENPLGSTSGWDIPKWMPALWGEYGFFWGGNYISRKDAMHFEFVLTPDGADQMLEKARKNGIGEDRMTDAEKQAFEALKEKVQELYAINKGMEDRLKDEAEPKDAGPRRAGWRRADRFLEEPAT